MTRVQALLIALSVAFAVVAGTYAAMQTTRLGTGATTHVSATAIANERKSLTHTAHALHRALEQKPPKLPPVRRPAVPAPHVVYVPGPSPVVTVAQQPVAAPPQRRADPKPVTRVVIVKHRTTAIAAAPVQPRPTAGTRGPAGPGTAPPATTTMPAQTIPAVVAPTTTTTPPVTTSHSSPPKSGGGDDGSSDDGGADD